MAYKILRFFFFKSRVPQKNIILYTTPFFWGYKMTNMGYLLRRKSGGGVSILKNDLYFFYYIFAL